MTIRKISQLLLLVIILPLCACGPSQAKLNRQTIQAADINLATQATEAPTPIPATETPAPIPAKFINPPEFLEEKFKASSGWMWMEPLEGRRFALQESKNRQTTFILVYENNMIGVGETGGFSDVFVNFVLEQFVPVSTRARIVQFRNDHSERGAYQNVIDGFIVALEQQGSNNDYILEIYESE